MFYIPCQQIIILDNSKELVNWVIKSKFLFLFTYSSISENVGQKNTICQGSDS